MLRYLLIPIAILVAAVGLVYIAAGHAAAPVIQIHQPGKLVGPNELRAQKRAASVTTRPHRIAVTAREDESV